MHFNWKIIWKFLWFCEFRILSLEKFLSSAFKVQALLTNKEKLWLFSIFLNALKVSYREHSILNLQNFICKNENLIIDWKKLYKVNNFKYLSIASTEPNYLSRKFKNKYSIVYSYLFLNYNPSILSKNGFVWVFPFFLNFF